jgi:biopolymer transport protein ExbD
MARIRQKHKITVEVPMASMSDVAFLLIIFFIVTSSFSKPSKLPLELPGESSDSSTADVTPAPRVRVGESRIYLNDQPVEFWQLTADLRTLLFERPLPENRVVILTGEANVPMERVVETMDAIRNAEAHVGFLELDVAK